MSKNKNTDNKKKKVVANIKSVVKKDSPPTINTVQPSLTWVGIGYQFLSIVRICKSVANNVHPAVYVHSAKENVVKPIVKRHYPEMTQNIVGASMEVIEFLVSPTRYILSIVSYTVAEKTGNIIKQNFVIMHPELRAGVDVVFNEAAFQAVKKTSNSLGKQHGHIGFFNKHTCSVKSLDKITSPVAYFRSKL